MKFKFTQVAALALYLTFIYLLLLIYGRENRILSTETTAGYEYTYNETLNTLSPYHYDESRIYKDFKTLDSSRFIQRMMNVYHNKKYFLEAEKKPHLDFRFYKKGQHIETIRELKSMFSVWNEFANKNNINYWLAHGTLLGWFFGGKIMPWDDDIDIQMTINDMYHLQTLNQTMINGRYLLDVNPGIRNRWSEKDNIIDARFIDMETGTFIDITALAFMGYHGNNSVVACKTPHFYDLYTLLPLRKTIFENVECYVSNDWRNHLVLEYGEKSLITTEYKGFKFDITSVSY